MVDTGGALISFLITAHVLLFFAGQAGAITIYESGDNPHKDFADRFLSGEFSDTYQIESDSTTLSETLGLGAKVLDFIGMIAGILASPYALFANSGLPSMFILLGQALLAFFEGKAVADFVRGVSL